MRARLEAGDAAIQHELGRDVVGLEAGAVVDVAQREVGPLGRDLQRVSLIARHRVVANEVLLARTVIKTMRLVQTVIPVAILRPRKDVDMHHTV